MHHHASVVLAALIIVHVRFVFTTTTMEALVLDRMILGESARENGIEKHENTPLGDGTKVSAEICRCPCARGAYILADR